MASGRGKCIHDPDHFCYICGSFTPPKQRKNITDFVKKAYHAYFGIKLGDQDKSWAPHVACRSCVESLRHWTKGRRSSLVFGIPMVWREPKNHTEDCYFCMTNLFGFNTKNKGNITYPDVRSAIRPVPHSEEIPVPVFKTLDGHSSESSDDSCDEAQAEAVISSCDEGLEPDRGPQTFNQAELNDLVRDLDLPKASAELLASRLNEKNLLSPGTKVTFFRMREKDLVQYFSMEDDFVYCKDIPGLLAAMNCTHDPAEWRFFIDSSKESLKCVLLHNGNQFASIPVGHSVVLKESYENLATVLQKIKYDEYNWDICGDLKVIGLLLGQQSGYTKYPCFLCMWDSRAKDKHWTQKVWPQGKNSKLEKRTSSTSPW